MVHFGRTCAVIFGLLISSACFAQPGREEYPKLAEEVHGHFDANVLHVWFPRCVDAERGGFRANFSREWVADKKQDRFLVFQARMTWLTSQVAMRRPELREEYRRYARHGVAVL